MFFVLGVRRHGFSQPFSLTIAALMFLLSVTWLVMALRSTSSLTIRTVGDSQYHFILLLMAHDIPSI